MKKHPEGLQGLVNPFHSTHISLIRREAHCLKIVRQEPRAPWTVLPLPVTSLYIVVTKQSRSEVPQSPDHYARVANGCHVGWSSPWFWEVLLETAELQG